MTSSRFTDTSQITVRLYTIERSYHATRRVFSDISVLNENRWINQSNVSREGVSRAASWPCEPLASS